MKASKSVRHFLGVRFNLSRTTRSFTFTIILAGILSSVCLQASATIISGSITGGTSLGQGGVFIKLSVPFTDSNPENTVGDDTFQNPNLYGFDEDQNIDITADLAVNILADGMGGGGGAGTVPMGSTVASHYIFFDPAGTTSQLGTISFDSDIFGIITSTGNLSASDFLVNTGVNYLNPSARGLEGADFVTITGLQTMSVSWDASTPGDYVRVLTDFSPGAIPVPPAVWLFTSALGLLGWMKRRQAS